MNSLHLTQSDLLLFIIATSGVLAGLLSYLMLPSRKREAQHCIKSILFGILFALFANLVLHFGFRNVVEGVPSELKCLFLWCVSFLPAFLMALAYGVFSRRYGKFEF